MKTLYLDCGMGAAGWRNMEDHGDGNRIFQQENGR